MNIKRRGIEMDKWLVIDTHNHHMPRQAASLAKAADGMDYAASLKRLPTGYDRVMDLEHRIQVMEGAGVNMVVLEQSSWSPQGLEMCRTMNDGQREAMKRFPGRFICCAHAPLDASPAILAELDRAINEIGCQGVSLVTSMAGRTLDSEELLPLYEKIAQLDVPIAVHPSIKRGVWGGQKYGLSDHVSREYDIAKATVEVLYGVLSRFPDLKFLMPHHGGGIPNQKGRIMAWHEPVGWAVPEELKGMPKTPRELKELNLDKDFENVFGKLYFDTAGFGGWMPITESAAKVIRTDRLCFGTDYPFEIHEAQDVKIFIDSIKALDLSDQEKRNILGENAKRLFKI
jgi:predicted TIM-barrel fold metal-dependent hydrolase